jgi:hypothetical protein
VFSAIAISVPIKGSHHAGGTARAQDQREADQTSPASPSSAAAAKAQSGCTRMNKAMHAVPSVIAAATQL